MGCSTASLWASQTEQQRNRGSWIDWDGQCLRGLLLHLTGLADSDRSFHSIVNHTSSPTNTREWSCSTRLLAGFQSVLYGLMYWSMFWQTLNPKVHMLVYPSEINIKSKWEREGWNQRCLTLCLPVSLLNRSFGEKKINRLINFWLLFVFVVIALNDVEFKQPRFCYFLNTTTKSTLLV